MHSILTADSSNNVGTAIGTINSGVVTPPSSGIGTAAPNLVFSTAPNSNESMQAPFSSLLEYGKFSTVDSISDKILLIFLKVHF